MAANVFPVIGARPVAEVNTDDVLRVLQPIWAKTPETASRVRGRLEATLNFAAATGLRERGLASENGLLRSRLEGRRRHGVVLGVRPRVPV